MKWTKLVKANENFGVKEEWNNHQASKQVKAQEEVTVTIPMSTYISWLSKELNETNERWGGEESVALAPKLLELIEEVGPGKNSDPDYIADNFVINGEFVSKKEFREGGENEWAFNKYNGDWQALCDDALVYDENYACMQF